ncbi:ABC transporter permease subunit [Bordetella petrii]|nr:ABC transporter permease subunit [Bordetella petrii]
MAAAQESAGRRLLLVGPSMILVAGVLVLPLLLMAAFSVWRFVPGQVTDYQWTLANYARLFSEPFYLQVVLETVELGLGVTLLSIVIGYPVAYYLARTTNPWQPVLMQLIYVPMMISLVVRAYGWMILLGFNGAVNSALLGLHIIDAPLRMLNSLTAVVLGLAEVLLPFMVLPLVACIKNIPPSVEEACRTLGGTPLQTFLRVTLPLSFPGIVSGSLMVFSLSITAYALPALLGGAKVKMISAIAYDTMLVSYNWPFGSAIGMLMVVVSGALVFGYLRMAPKGA